MELSIATVRSLTVAAMRRGLADNIKGYLKLISVDRISIMPVEQYSDYVCFLNAILKYKYSPAIIFIGPPFIELAFANATMSAKRRGYYLAEDKGKRRRINVAKTMGISHGFVVTKLK